MSMNVPYRLSRLGVIMSPDPASDLETEGVLNPGSGRSPDGKLWLLPRLVATGNVSRVGIAEIVVADGQPTEVRRDGVVLAPDEGWEQSHDHAGVEDPRTTWIADLGLHVMSYVAFGPLGPHPALAVSADLRRWQRLGPVHFEYQPDLDTDLNLFPNKDVVLFPELVPGPDGRPAYAMMHRPMWDLGWIRGGTDIYVPAGIEDSRPGIWISYAPADEVQRDVQALTHVRSHRLVALSEYDYEALTIGAGPAPIRVPEGWLLIHHGVSGRLVEGWDAQQHVRYCAGAALLDEGDPGTVLARTPVPLLEPSTSDELDGTVPNVIFPTAIEEIDGQRFVFYGMADSKIGVALLESNSD